MKSIKDFKTIIIVPFYEDETSLNFLLQDLQKTFNNKFYIMVVDDGSINCKITDQTLKLLNAKGCVIKLKRNVGHQQAIAIGIKYISQYVTSNQTIIVMDSDGEDLPKSAKILSDEISKEEVDIVVAKRDKRTETFSFKIFYSIYKFIFYFLTGRVIDFGNFIALKKPAILRLSSMPELSIHIAASVISSKMNIKKVPINRGKRYANESKMNFVSLTLHGFRALMVFTEEVLVRVCLIYILVATLAAIGSIMAIALKIFGFSSPGWFSIALGILLLIMLQTGALALSLLISAGKSIEKQDTVESNKMNLVDKIFE